MSSSSQTSQRVLEEGGFPKVVSRAVMAEFVGTALLVYMSCGASVSASILFPGMTPARIMCEALATGGAYIFLMYSITTISGGLLNPAVTFALAITGKVGIITAFFYFVAQVVGGVVGAGLLRASIPDSAVGALGASQVTHGVTMFQAISWEFMFTFALVYVYFATAVDPRRKTPDHPIAVGFVGVTSVIVAGPFTGGSMNPSRSFAPALVTNDMENQGVYWIGPFLGAICAALLYSAVFLTGADDADDAKDDSEESAALKTHGQTAS